MSQGIMERNLPVAESIGEGDKVRIVTSAGNSKNIDASLIGGGALKVTITKGGTASNVIYSTDKTYRQIANAQSLLFVEAFSDEVGSGYHAYELSAYGNSDDGHFVVLVPYGSGLSDAMTFVADSEDEILVFSSER